MAAHLRCWNCDQDLPSPAFAKWRARQTEAGEPPVVACGNCGSRYRLGWTAGGWQIIEALRPARAPRPRR